MQNIYIYKYTEQQHKNINLSTSRGPNNCKIANSPNKSLPKINNIQSMGHSTCNLLAHPAHFAMPVPSITGDFQIITEMPNHFCGLAVVSYIYACIHTYVCISQLPTPSPIPIPIPSWTHLDSCNRSCSARSPRCSRTRTFHRGSRSIVVRRGWCVHSGLFFVGGAGRGSGILVRLFS